MQFLIDYYLHYSDEKYLYDIRLNLHAFVHVASEAPMVVSK